MIEVSVILPAYQAQAHLESTVRALLSEKEIPLELLCIDDGSDDGTGPLLDRLAAEDARLRVWHTENKGVSAARNLGLSHATGRYVAFLDADDVLPPGALAGLCATCGGADIVVGDYEIRSLRGQLRRISPPDPLTREAALHSLISGEGSYNAPWAKLYRHDFLWEHTLAFSQTLRIGEDALFNLEAFSKAQCIRRSGALVYTYIQREDSAMGRAGAARYDHHEPMLDAMDALLLREGIKTAYFRDFLQLHAALIQAQYGPKGPQAFARRCPPRLLDGVRPGQLPLRQQLLYAALRTGRGRWVYRHLIEKEET